MISSLLTPYLWRWYAQFIVLITVAAVTENKMAGQQQERQPAAPTRETRHVGGDGLRSIAHG